MLKNTIRQKASTTGGVKSTDLMYIFLLIFVLIAVGLSVTSFFVNSNDSGNNSKIIDNGDLVIIDALQSEDIVATKLTVQAIEGNPIANLGDTTINGNLTVTGVLTSSLTTELDNRVTALEELPNVFSPDQTFDNLTVNERFTVKGSSIFQTNNNEYESFSINQSVKSNGFSNGTFLGFNSEISDDGLVTQYSDSSITVGGFIANDYDKMVFGTWGDTSPNDVTKTYDSILTSNAALTIKNGHATQLNNLIGINTTDPQRRLEIVDGSSNDQVRIGYSSSIYTDLKTDSNGNFSIKPTGTLVTIDSDLIVNGTLTYAGDSSVQLNDPYILVGASNTSNLVDLGWHGKYSNAVNEYYTGIFRDADENGTLKVYDYLTSNPDLNVVDITNSDARYAKFWSSELRVYNSNVTLNSSSNYTTFTTSNEGSLILTPSNNFIIPTGNVGFGTGDPSSNLHVVGTGYFTGNVLIGGTLNTVGDLTTDDITSASILAIDTSPQLTLSNSGGGNTTFGTDTNGYAIFTASGERFALGSTSPCNYLDIGGATVIGSGYVGKSNAPTNGLLVEGETNLNDALTITTTSPQLTFCNGTSNVTFGIDTEGDLTITPSGTTTTINSDLVVTGSTTFIGTTYTVDDPYILLGNTNAANLVDLGWHAKYVDGSTYYTGIFHDADEPGTLKIYDYLTDSPTTNVVDTTNADARFAKFWSSDLYVYNSNEALNSTTNYAIINVDNAGDLHISPTGESIAIGFDSGVSNQGTKSVSIGSHSGSSNQGIDSIAIGYYTGFSNQGNSAIAIGSNAGSTDQGYQAVAIGPYAGSNLQSYNSVAIGLMSGQISQGVNCVAIGQLAGNRSQTAYSVAIGLYAGSNTQKQSAVAIGHQSGQILQGLQSIAIGKDTGRYTQGDYAIAMGLTAGNTYQEAQAISFGYYAGESNQKTAAIAIGSLAGRYKQSNQAVAIGTNSGYSNQGRFAISMGDQSGEWDQGESAISIGRLSGENQQGTYAVSIGTQSGQIKQGNETVSIGYGTAYSNQGIYAIAIGRAAASFGQKQDGIGIGRYAAYSNQAINSIAIGRDTGKYNQSNESISIGYFAAESNQGNSSIAIGLYTGQLNQGAYATAVGRGSAYSNQGIYASAFGMDAGQYNQSNYATAVGFRAGRYIQADYTTAVGANAGYSNQGKYGVAVGANSGYSNQGVEAIAIGLYAGNENQDIYSVAIGSWAAVDTQEQESIAIGYYSGQTTQGRESIAIGTHVGQNNQGWNSIAIGAYAGSNSQTRRAVAIGSYSGTFTQGEYATALGWGAGYDTQGDSTVAVGNTAGETNQNDYAIAIGLTAGRYEQETYSVSIGANAGYSNQKSYSIAIGNNAAYSNQGTNSIALGRESGYSNQGTDAIAIAAYAGKVSQGQYGIAIGDYAGTFKQGYSATAINHAAGYSNQGSSAIAIGNSAGRSNQGNQAIAIGVDAGRSNQTIDAISIGNSAGYCNQGNAAIAIGLHSGKYNSGSTCIAIGYLSGSESQGDYSVALGREAGSNNQQTTSVAIGYSASVFRQEANAVSLGAYAGNSNQQGYGISIGREAGRYKQGSTAIAIGGFAGRDFQNGHAVAIGYLSGNSNQGTYAIAMGRQAGSNKQGNYSIALGYLSAVATQGNNAIAVGYNAGSQSQGQYSIAIGSDSGVDSQGTYAVALGNGAALQNQGNYGVSIGYNAGFDTQGTNSVAIGNSTAGTTQGTNAVAIGTNAASSTQGNYGIAIGFGTAEQFQSTTSIALGYNAAYWFQGADSISIGNFAGNFQQGASALAIGSNAGYYNQGDYTIAIGYHSGERTQSDYSVAVGWKSGMSNQGWASTAVGPDSGWSNQGQSSVSIGHASGYTNQGDYAFAAGYAAGYTNQGDYSIALGSNAGTYNQGTYAVSMGKAAGSNTQSSYAVAIGNTAGAVSQGTAAVAIGNVAGGNTQYQNAVAIGNVAGYQYQEAQSVAVGYYAGAYNQKTYSVAVGGHAGHYNQKNYSVAVGTYAGSNTQGAVSTAVGYYAGNYLQSDFAVAMGPHAAQTSQGQFGVAIGYFSGYNLQSTGTVAIGAYAGQNNQSADAVAIGSNAGKSNQSSQSVAVGVNAGNYLQSANSVTIGPFAGSNAQGTQSVAMGYNAGAVSQGVSSVAIGPYAGQTNQGADAVAIGSNAGNSTQGIHAVAVGVQAGANVQGQYGVAVGQESGKEYQKDYAVAIGYRAGQYYQSNLSIAIGSTAGSNYQGQQSIAIGNGAGRHTQRDYTVAIGTVAGYCNQSNYSVAIGFGAGNHAQGSNAIAIGQRAGFDSQDNNTIVLNATGTILNTSNTDAFYVNPVRVQDANSKMLVYDTTDNEITYNTYVDVDSAGNITSSGTISGAAAMFIAESPQLTLSNITSTDTAQMGVTSSSTTLQYPNGLLAIGSNTTKLQPWGSALNNLEALQIYNGTLTSAYIDNAPAIVLNHNLSTTTGIAGMLIFANQYVSGTEKRLAQMWIETNGRSNHGRMYFGTASNSSITKLMSYDHEGRLLVNAPYGTTASANLHVVGTGYFSDDVQMNSNLTMSGGSYTTTLGTSNNGNFNIDLGADEKEFSVRSGDTRTWSFLDDGTRASIGWQVDGDTNKSWDIGVNTDTTGPSNLIFRYLGDVGTKMVITHQGNVGINTTSPDNLLHIESDVSNHLKLSTTTNARTANMYLTTSGYFCVESTQNELVLGAEGGWSSTYAGINIRDPGNGNQGRAWFRYASNPTNLYIGTTGSGADLQCYLNQGDYDFTYYDGGKVRTGLKVFGNNAASTGGTFVSVGDMPILGYATTYRATVLQVGSNSVATGGSERFPMINLAHNIGATATNAIGSNVFAGGLYWQNINYGGATGSINAMIYSSTGPSGSNYGQLHFETTNNGTRNERMRINEDGNVGIGTTAPNFPLSFGSGIGSKIALYESSGNFMYGFGIQSSLLETIIPLTSTDFTVGVGTSGSLSKLLTVKGTGNVGIGDDTPSYKLDVNGTGRFTGAVQMDSTLSTTGNVGIGTTAGTSPLRFAEALGAKISLYGDVYSFGIQPNLFETILPTTGEDFTIGVGTSGSLSRLFTVEGTGNVGIGTINNLGSLNTSYAKMVIYNNSANMNGNTIAMGLSINRTNDAAGALYLGADITSNAVFGSGNSSMLFGKWVNDTYNEYMRIDTSGNMGLGDSTPSYKLDVNGTGRFTGAVQMDSTLSTTGNVGIGTAPTSDPLTITYSQNGLTDITLNNLNIGSSAQARFKAVTNGGYCVFGKTSDASPYSGAAFVWNNDNTDLMFATNATQHMTLTSVGNLGLVGNLGIGTTTPLLDVGSVSGDYPSAWKGLHIKHTNAVLALEGSSGSRIHFADSGATTNNRNYVINWNDEKLSFGNAVDNLGSGDIHMVILETGNIGIGGILSPAYKLELSGTGTTNFGHTDVNIIGTGAVGAGLSLDATGTGGQKWSIFSGSGVAGGSNLAFYNVDEGSYAMLLKNAGGDLYNLGLGTTSPSYRLEVSGTGLDSGGNSDVNIIGTDTIGAGISLDATATDGDKWTIVSTANTAGIAGGNLGFFNVDQGSYAAAIMTNSNETDSYCLVLDNSTPASGQHYRHDSNMLYLHDSRQQSRINTSTLKFDGTERAQLVIEGYINSSKDAPVGYPTGIIDFRASNAGHNWSMAHIMASVDPNNNTGYSGGLHFMTSDGGSTNPPGVRTYGDYPSIKMSIDGSGNVGVGTAAPSSNFHVVGDGYFTGTLQVDGDIIGSGSSLGTTFVSADHATITLSNSTNNYYTKLGYSNQSYNNAASNTIYGDFIINPNTSIQQIQGTTWSTSNFAGQATSSNIIGTNVTHDTNLEIGDYIYIYTSGGGYFTEARIKSIQDMSNFTLQTEINKFQGSNLWKLSAVKCFPGSSEHSSTDILMNGDGFTSYNAAWGRGQHWRIGSTIPLCAIGRRPSSSVLQHWSSSAHQWDIGSDFDGSINNTYMYLNSTGLQIANKGVDISPTCAFSVTKDSTDATPNVEGIFMGVHSGQYASIELASTASTDGGWIDFTRPNVDYRGRIRYFDNTERMAFYTHGSGTEMMTLSNGVVGIGTTSPSPLIKLSIVSSDTSTNANAPWDSTASIAIENTDTTDNNMSSIVFSTKDSGGTGRTAGSIVAQFTAHTTTVSGDLVFGTTAANTHTEKMRLTSSGYLGIGTTSPSSNLHVVGTGYFTGAVQMDSSLTTDSLYVQQPVNDGNSKIIAAGSASTASGNGSIIGMGNTTGTGWVPTIYSLTSNSVSDSTDQSMAFIAEITPALETSTTTPMFDFIARRFEGGYTNIANRQILRIQNNTTSLFCIAANSNVGINDSDPAAKLEIRSGNDEILYLSKTGSAQYKWDFSGSDLSFTNDGGKQFMFYEYATGDVGVGTVTPTARLEVDDDTATSPVVYITNDAADTGSLETEMLTFRARYLHSDTTLNEVGALSTYRPINGTNKFDLRLKSRHETNGLSTVMTLKNDGFVGIGNTNPTLSGASHFLSMGTTGSGGDYGLSKYQPGSGLWHMDLVTEGVSRLRIEDTGEVGIGTTAAATAQLEVLDTTTQLKLSYDATDNATFTVNSSGDLTIATYPGTLNISPYVAYTLGHATSLKLHNFVTGVIVTSANSAKSNFHIATLRPSTSSTIDSIHLKATIGGWRSDDQATLDIYLGNRDYFDSRVKVEGDGSYSNWCTVVCTSNADNSSYVYLSTILQYTTINYQLSGNYRDGLLSTPSNHGTDITALSSYKSTLMDTSNPIYIDYAHDQNAGIVHYRHSNSLDIYFDADTDNVTETHNPTIHLRQDSNLVEYQFGIDSNNAPYHYHRYTGSFIWRKYNQTYMGLESGSNLGIGVPYLDAVGAKTEIRSTGTQLRLSYDSDTYHTFTCDANGHLTIAGTDNNRVYTANMFATSTMNTQTEYAYDGSGVILNVTNSKPNFRNYRSGGSYDIAGVMFSEFSTRHYIMGCSNDKGLLWNYSTENSDRPAVEGGTISTLMSLSNSATGARLGIGTVSASSNLHVAGTSKFDGNMLISNATCTITGNNARLRLHREGGDNYIDFNNANDLHFRSTALDDTSQTIRMTIDTSGKVGIGTETIPHGGIGAAKFAIDGTVTSLTDGPHVQYTVSTDDFPVFQQLNWSHDNICLMFDAYYNGAWKSADAGTNFNIYKNGDQLKFQFNAGTTPGASFGSWTTSAIIGNNGHWAFNTTPSSTYWIYANGDIGVTNGWSFLNHSAATASTSRNFGVALWTDKAFGMELAYNSTSTDYDTRLFTRTDGNITFGNYAANETQQGNFTEWGRFDKTTGYFGLNVTAPLTQLQVSGTVTIVNNSGGNYNENLRLPEASAGWSSICLGTNPAAAFGTQDGQWTIGKNPSDTFKIWHHGFQNGFLNILKTGEVGISNASPNHRLDISSTTSPQFCISNGTDSTTFGTSTSGLTIKSTQDRVNIYAIDSSGEQGISFCVSDDDVSGGSSRIYFKEDDDESPVNGASIIYAGITNPTLGGTGFTATANSYNLFMHHGGTIKHAYGIDRGDAIVDIKQGMTLPNGGSTLDHYYSFSSNLGASNIWSASTVHTHVAGVRTGDQVTITITSFSSNATSASYIEFETFTGTSFSNFYPSGYSNRICERVWVQNDGGITNGTLIMEETDKKMRLYIDYNNNFAGTNGTGTSGIPHDISFSYRLHSNA